MDGVISTAQMERGAQFRQFAAFIQARQLFLERLNTSPQQIYKTYE